MDQYKGRHMTKYERAALCVFLIIAGLFALLLIVNPTLDVRKRERANEASAVGRVDAILKLERSYAANHPTAGYSCELSRLRSAPPTNSDYDSEAFLKTGEWLGYRYALVDCSAEPNGKVRHFRVTAVPIKTIEAGFQYRAFCADDSGVIRYDTGGSGDKCVATGTALLR